MMNKKTFDVAVVGTGPSSYFFVHSLMKKSPVSTICVLEAGFRKKELSRQLFNMSPQGMDFNFSPTTYIGYGGTSKIWHNIFTPLDPIDFKRRSWIPNSGWPISLNDINPYYIKVSDILNLDYHLFFEKCLPSNVQHLVDEVGFNRDVFENKIFLQPAKYFRAFDYFNDLLKKNEHRLCVKFGFIVEELLGRETVAGNFSATGVVGINLANNAKEEVRARSIVLCAGALYTPRILLNTNYLFDCQKNIGRFLMDHPMGNFYQFEHKHIKSKKIYGVCPVKKGLNIKVGIRLKETMQEELKMPNSAFYLRASFHLGSDNITEKSKENLIRLKDKILSGKFPMNEAVFWAKNFSVTGKIILYKTVTIEKHTLSDVMFVTEQLPSPSSLIMISKKNDPWGYKKLDCSWNIKDIEEEYMRKYYSLIDEHIVVPTRSRMTFGKDNVPWKKRLRSAAHHLGTCRMGKTPENSVVDKNNKIFGTKNIFVCDGSIFPTSGNANPTFTLMALAYRLGESLGKEI